METQENKSQSLNCPCGVPEAECCGNMSCKTLIARIKAKKVANK